MSVQTQIDRINQNVANTYAVLGALGADMPVVQTSDNLAETAGTAKAVLYSAQTLTDAQKEQARENIGAVSNGELQNSIDAALTQAKESGEFDGADGERGTGVLRITTAPTAYTTVTGGYTPAYRIALSTVKSQSGASEVLVGDTVLRNYYTYPVGYVDASYVYLGKYASIRGTAGTSVTIASVTESTESGGANEIVFSDESTLTVRNGKPGRDGDPGYTPQRGIDYYTESDREELVDDVSSELSQQITTEEYKKDVAEHVPIVKVAEQPTFVNSVDEMTDTSKMYVLKSDGMFYSYKKITTTIPGNKVPNFTNLADSKSSDWKTGYRLNSSGSPTEEAGTTVTNYIPILQNQVIRIKGIDLTTKNCSVSKADKVNIVSSKLSAQSAYFSNISVTTTEASFTVTNANLRWIRFAGVLNGAADDVIITANQEITYTETPPSTETTYEWSSTGIAYNQPADYEDRVIALEKNAANNSADIDVLKQQIADMGSGAAVTTIPEWWEDEVEDTIAKIKALQVGRNCVTFPFFSDNHQRNGYAGMLIAKVMKECNIPYCFYGGDSISSGIILNEAEMIAQDKAFDTAMSYVPSGRFCRAVGNHDGYWYDGTNKFYYSREQVYELFLREESIAQNKHFGDDGTYYYIDDVASKVRWIVLNFNDYDDAQLAWLDTALTFPESGWGVVFISHAPITSHYGAYTAKDAAVRTKLKDYINGSATNKAVVIGWFGGHIHRDRIFNGVASNPGYDGSTDPTTDAATGNPIGETLPWKTITIISDNVAIGYGGVTHAIDNSDQSHAIDFVTINKSTHTVNITRLGFGEDRSYTY